MTNRQEAKLKMYLALRVFLKINESSINPLPNAAEFITALDKAILLIQTYSEFKQFKGSGNTEAKNQYRDVLEKLSLENAGKIHAWAKYKKNELLIAETKTNQTKLNKLTDIKLLDFAKGLLNRINTDLTSLTDYKLNAATQDTFKNQIELFENSVPSIKNTKVNFKEATKQIAKGITDADEAIDNLDSLVEMIRFSESILYTDYKATRKIDNSRSNNFVFKALVTDAAGNPVKDVVIRFFDKNNGNAEVLKKKTAAKGGINVTNLADGEYSLTFEKPGYQPQKADAVINSGELKVLKIQLTEK